MNEHDDEHDDQHDVHDDVPIQRLMRGLRRMLCRRYDDLVYLYEQSRCEHLKNGKLSMEIGTARERDFVAFLKSCMGDKVSYDVDHHAPEDVIICGERFSIKHVSAPAGRGTIKLKWTADAIRAHAFQHAMVDAISASQHHPYLMNTILVFVDDVARSITVYGITKSVMFQAIQTLQHDSFRTSVGTNHRGVAFSTPMIRHMVTNASFRVVIQVGASTKNTRPVDPIERRVRLLASRNPPHKKSF